MLTCNEHRFGTLAHSRALTVGRRNDCDEAIVGVEARQGHSRRYSREEIRQRCSFRCRAGNVAFAYTETRPPLKYVLDVTIGYTNGEALSADQLWFGTRRECEDIHVYYKVRDDAVW